MTKQDKNIVALMYAIMVEQNSAIWEKLSGRDQEANKRVEKLVGLMFAAETEIEKWADIKDLFKEEKKCK